MRAKTFYITCALVVLLCISVIGNIVMERRNAKVVQSSLRTQLETIVTQLNRFSAVFSSIKGNQSVSQSQLDQTASMLMDVAYEVNGIGHWTVANNWSGFSQLTTKLVTISSEVQEFSPESKSKLAAEADEILQLSNSLGSIAPSATLNMSQVQQVISKFNDSAH